MTPRANRNCKSYFSHLRFAARVLGGSLQFTLGVIYRTEFLLILFDLFDANENETELWKIIQ